jgi:hypothetical protein
MKSSLLRLFLCTLTLAFVAASQALAQTQRGTIKAAGVTGTVSLLAADGTTKPLANGAILSESDTVVTGPASGVVLVFMNGSTIKLGANSRLAVEEFKMDPLGAEIAVSKLKAEPSVSKTSLNLAYGEMVGDVKKLNTAKGSTFNVKTPVGAAGIRGTTFRIVFTPSANGQAMNFTLSTSEGVVLFTGTTPGAAPVAVSQGNEVAVTAEVNTTTGAVSNVQVQSQAISAEATQAIQTAVADVIQQAQAAAVFTREEQTSTATSTPAPETPAPQTPAPETPKTETSPPPPPPQTTTPQPIDPSTVSRSG